MGPGLTKVCSHAPLQMSTFPTVVPDTWIRDSLCTLPFMTAEFRRNFRAQLDARSVPSLRERTTRGKRFCELLRREAERRSLRYVDAFTPLLGPEGTSALLNTDQNHHLVHGHIRYLLEPLKGAFGGAYVHAPLPLQQGATLASPLTLPSADVMAAAMEWFSLFSLLRSGQPTLKLRGHVCGSYQDVVDRFGAPLPLQLATPSTDQPGFATWLVRVEAQRTTPTRAQPGARSEPSQSAMVRILGRYRNYHHTHAWLVECSDSPSVMEQIRSIMSHPPCPLSQRGYDTPPAAFHAALAGRR